MTENKLDGKKLLVKGLLVFILTVVAVVLISFVVKYFQGG